MVDDYYPTAPQILTEQMYFNYGGQSGTSTAFQLAAAFTIAEYEVAGELGTPVTPSPLSGTYSIPQPGRPLQLRKKYLQSIQGVSLVLQCPHDCTLSTCDRCAVVINDVDSVIVVSPKWDAICPCACACVGIGYPRALAVYYTAGLPASINLHPTFLLALTVVAGIVREQISDPGAAPGGPGAPGIIQWSNMRYQQTNARTFASRLGRDPRAQYAADLLKGFKKMRAPAAGY